MSSHAQGVEQLMVPPQSVEAEQAVLGAVLVDAGCLDAVLEHVGAGDFYRRDHRLVFEVVSELAGAGHPVDVVTVAERLGAAGTLEDVGGVGYLGALATGNGSVANVARYAQIVRGRSMMRSLISVGNQIADSGFNPEGRDVAELLSDAERAVFGLSERDRSGSSFVTMKQSLTRVVDRIDELFTSKAALTGVPTGYGELDEKLLGLQRSDLVIIAGRPSMGKTSLAMNIAEHAALQQGLPVAVFSMEMPDDQLTMRLLSSIGRIGLKRIRSGQLEDEDWPRLTSAIGKLSDSPIYIDSTGGLTPAELRSRARRLSREHGVGLIVVDYLQLMEASANASRENRNTAISEISRGLKALAKELNVPVIALSQLNRSLEQRANKRPVLSDLRESGAIEQDADVILFVYRDEVYNQDSADRGTAEVIIGKQRNGEIGTVRLAFLGQFARFENYSFSPRPGDSANEGDFE